MNRFLLSSTWLFGVALILIAAPRSFAGNGCSTDADCNDGIFCNGQETCDVASGGCVAVSACPPAIEGCVIRGGFCDEDNNQCVDIADDSFCDDGDPCTDDICQIDTGDCLHEPQSCGRVSSTQKGSLLIFSKIEIKWDAEGNLIQDTFVDITNDYPADVDVQGFFINGDIELEEICTGNPCDEIVQDFEPGWNTADCLFEMTANQPHFWSAANGSNKCQAFTVLDPDGPGRPDPETLGATRVLRGYAIFWAVDFFQLPNPGSVWWPIKWNHLKGDAVLVNYADGSAWEYNAWAFQARASSALPRACDSGTDPHTGDAWVVCDADSQSAWISSAVGGGQYHPQLICEELGYETYGQFGGNCNSVCGWCEGGTSCENTGRRNFDGNGDAGSDIHGQHLQFTVTWECLNFGRLPGQHGDPVGTSAGRLRLDGTDYDAPYASLLLDFYGSGSMALSGGDQSVMVDTDLTVHPVGVDLRQDGCGPVLTKVEAEIWNEFESKFSGTRRCVCCWDQTMLSDWARSVAIPNHFTRTELRTDKGKARLNGVASNECDYYELCGPMAYQKMTTCGRDDEVLRIGGDYSQDAAILGLATKFLTFSPSDEKATAGMNLVGMGEEAAYVISDPMFGPDEARTSRPPSAKGAGAKGATIDRNATDRDTEEVPAE